MAWRKHESMKRRSIEALRNGSGEGERHESINESNGVSIISMNGM